MLIDYNLQLVIRPNDYPGTLAIRLQTDNEPGFGVRSGRHNGFGYNHPEEQDVWMPRFRMPLEPGADQSDIAMADFSGVFDYVIDRPERRATPNQLRTYNYVVVGKGDGVYYDFPDIHILGLIETSTEWHMTWGRPHGDNGFTLMLDDYEPGWIQRTGAQAL